MTTSREQVGALTLLVGGLSFIPLIGIPFGIIAILWGLTTQKEGGKKLALLGAGGITLTVVIYSGIYYFSFMQRGGIYDELRRKQAEHSLVSLVFALEFHRAQFGYYPDTLVGLEAALPIGAPVPVYDAFDTSGSDTPRKFHYEKVGDAHYRLLSVGPDERPYTADDIVPSIEAAPSGTVGLLVEAR